MRKITGLLAALGAGAALALVPAGAAGASADTATDCSTWQYYTDTHMPIYSGPSSASQVIDFTGEAGILFVNVTRINGDFRYGNFYFQAAGPASKYAEGWIWVGHIHYFNCW